MGINDILRRVKALAAGDAPKPARYEVWHARWPRNKYREDGKPQGHFVLVMEALANDEFRCLMIDTDRGKHRVAYELSPEQAKDAGIHRGVFFFNNSHLVPGDRFDNRTGFLTRVDALEIETAVCRPRSRA